jgi:hypothetical protein
MSFTLGGGGGHAGRLREKINDFMAERHFEIPVMTQASTTGKLTTGESAVRCYILCLFPACQCAVT